MFLAMIMVGGCGKPTPPAGSEKSNVTPALRLLLVGDPFALALQKIRPQLEENLGHPIEIDIVGYNDNRRIALLNASDRVSRDDVISFDSVWRGEFAAKRILMPLPGTLGIPRDAFLPGTLGTVSGGEEVIQGLPIQPHAELLWIRGDLFDQAGLRFPDTPDELLAAARRLHDPARGLYGIVWNAQRGQPLGQTMAHVFASFGQALIDKGGKPDFETERGLRAARFVMSLLEVSPPDILNMAWDQRVGRFASGSVAMTYGWGARAFQVEEDPASYVRGKVRYGPPPHCPDAPPVVPLGCWSLGIPANAGRPELSLRFLQILYSPEIQTLLSNRGNGAPPLLTQIQDPLLQQRYPVLAAMASPEILEHLSDAMRPSVPEWDGLCEILGTEFHEMLKGRVTPETALHRAQTAAEALFHSPPEAPRVKRH